MQLGPVLDSFSVGLSAADDWEWKNEAAVCPKHYRGKQIVLAKARTAPGTASVGSGKVAAPPRACAEMQSGSIPLPRPRPRPRTYPAGAPQPRARGAARPGGPGAAAAAVSDPRSRPRQGGARHSSARRRRGREPREEEAAEPGPGPCAPAGFTAWRPAGLAR